MAYLLKVLEVFPYVMRLSQDKAEQYNNRSIGTAKQCKAVQMREARMQQNRKGTRTRGIFQRCTMEPPFPTGSYLLITPSFTNPLMALPTGKVSIPIIQATLNSISRGPGLHYESLSMESLVL